MLLLLVILDSSDTATVFFTSRAIYTHRDYHLYSYDASRDLRPLTDAIYMQLPAYIAISSYIRYSDYPV